MPHKIYGNLVSYFIETSANQDAIEWFLSESPKSQVIETVTETDAKDIPDLNLH